MLIHAGKNFLNIKEYESIEYESILTKVLFFPQYFSRQDLIARVNWLANLKIFFKFFLF